MPLASRTRTRQATGPARAARDSRWLTHSRRLFWVADRAARAWQHPGRRTGYGLAPRAAILSCFMSADRDLGWLLGGPGPACRGRVTSMTGKVTHMTWSVSMAVWRAAWPAAL